MSRILITGGSSYLGQHLVPLAAASHIVHHTYHQNQPNLPAAGSQLDIRDETAVSTLITTFQPDIIIHLAGSNRGSDMASVIRLGASSVVWAAREVGARLIHLSTDSIFAGDAAPYAETAVPTPVNAYGRAKADAEAIVQQHANSVIVRTSLIYGLAQMDHGTRWMAEALAQGQPVTLFNNQIRNPVWVNSLVHALLELAHHRYTGILNVAGRQVLSRADFALKLLDYWQVQPRDTLTIAPSDGSWPLNCELDLQRATAVLQTPLPGVDEVLAMNVRIHSA
ncbi:MAG: SDR family oxidoreductase [Ardenticatenaceae bacterium]|nr:SDR family oxidoreductase [Ardenticatenaceae bacterium]MCB9442623.1 SDR family oxidoreductase [Ardenticatenaceae bacterium]